MILKYLLAALLCVSTPALAQKTGAELNTEIGALFPNNNSGTITPSVLRRVTSDMVNSIMPTAPVVAGNLACFIGTTGLLKDCGKSPTSILGSNNTWTGTNTFTGGSVTSPSVSIFPNSGSPDVNMGLLIQQSAAGSPTLDPSTSFYNLNRIAVFGDQISVPNGSNGTVSALDITHTFGGPNMSGNRVPLSVVGFMSAPSGTDPIIGTASRNYSGNFIQMSTASGDGGTGLTPETAKGAMFGFNPNAFLMTGATNWFHLNGGEVDIGVQNGASVVWKTALSLVYHNLDRVQGAVYDTMLSFTRQGDPAIPGGRSAILIGDMAGAGAHPLSANATIFATTGTSTVDTFIDFSSYTATNKIFNFQNFVVNAAGDLAIGGITNDGTSPLNVRVASGQNLRLFGGSSGAGITLNSLNDASSAFSPLEFAGSSFTFKQSGGSIKITGATSGTGTLSVPAVASSYVWTLPAATDTLVGKATTDTLTNKTFDTAGTGNSFSINGVAATANTGTGAVARGVAPSFTGNVSVGGAVSDASLVIKNGTDANLHFYARNHLASGLNLSMVNDASNANTGLEFTASAYYFAAGAAQFVNATDATSNATGGIIASGGISSSKTIWGRTIATDSFTVSGLPSCAAGTKGSRAYVTDATTPTFLGTLTGGGVVVAPVLCNGAAWVAG